MVFGTRYYDDILQFSDMVSDLFFEIPILVRVARYTTVKYKNTCTCSRMCSTYTLLRSHMRPLNDWPRDTHTYSRCVWLRFFDVDEQYMYTTPVHRVGVGQRGIWLAHISSIATPQQTYANLWNRRNFCAAFLYRNVYLIGLPEDEPKRSRIRTIYS